LEKSCLEKEKEKDSGDSAASFRALILRAWMKILYLAGFAWEPKGTVRSRAFPLAVEMVRRGHEVTLLIAPYDNLVHSGRRFVSEGVQVINLEISGRGALVLARLPRQFLDLIDRIAPDLVHVFKPKGLAGITAMALLDRGYRALVVDCDDWEGWGGWNEVSRYPWVLKEFIDLQERWLVCNVPVVTAASRVLTHRARDLGKVPDRVFYVPNGISREQANSVSSRTRNMPPDRKRALGLSERPLILYAGHFDTVDDVPFFCRAAAPAALRHGATIALLGDGPGLGAAQRFFSSFQDLQVRCLGQLPYAEYAQFVAACDVATFPYPDHPVYRAKCSARIIDYMAFGKPILTTAVGQNMEYLVDGESGILTAAGDEKAYGAGLDGLLRDGDLRTRLGENARRRLLDNFLWSGRAADECEKAYTLAASLC
jgi:glycosyltransferase involved in cell wall biosynthesis